ncbi:hypothetical protein CCR75_003885 [Bremia lactucae]|uniref:Cation-transporting ATPase n=1 Tax=Bremia lactucae TaxID=4779 RepID=A0A976NYG2_BRELC|nr:hypothetical protein CCR75_003885 [Bremia lactucae]
MVVTVGVTDPELTSVVLYSTLPWPMRLDFLPFLFFYVTAVYLNVFCPEGDVISWIFGALCVFLHMLALLSAEWSVDVRCWMTCARLKIVEQNEHRKVLAKVKPSLPMLPKQLCDCHVVSKDTITKNTGPTVWFSFQNLKFYLFDDIEAINSSGTSHFRRLDFPVDRSLESYLQSNGINSDEELQQARDRWGRNEFELSVPNFTDLLKEQLVAPFFVFQVFCMLLWCLDEYMYYSVMTLFMLIIFECTVVKQRQQNVDTLLHMRNAPQPCLVYRLGRWTRILSDDLVPGDICSTCNNEGATRVPCDLLLLRGNCIVNEAMLSGESIPLRKESVEKSIVDEVSKLKALEVDTSSSMQHKRHALYGGTKILQHSVAASKDLLKISSPPDGGCIGFVLKTGFGTTQGSLMRTILYSSQRVTANNLEAMWFIVLLLNFAFAAAAFVLSQGMNDPTRDQFKLFLHCIMIITSVVPPELPMELSLAKCSELEIICSEKFPLDTELVLAGCQSLVLFNGQVAGDPLELTAIQKIKWCLTSRTGGSERLPSVQPSYLSVRRGEIQAVDILHSLPFSSELKRMSTVVCVRKSDNDEKSEQRVLTKGAPEVLELIFTNKPSYYRRVYRYYASKGCRVLALGFRVLSEDIALPELRRKPREELEKGLTFAGFLILDCPLKEDTKRTIQELVISKHKVCMITGDNPLTACDVARQVGINAGYSKQPLVLSSDAEKGYLQWNSIDDSSLDIEKEILPFNVEQVEKMQARYDLCVTGEALEMLHKQQEKEQNDNVAALERFLSILEKMCLSITVFARTSPQQKEHIIMAMNRRGKITAMCGDGTNDVGALKQAHIGISILNASSSENAFEDQNAALGDKNAAVQGNLRRRRQAGNRRRLTEGLQQSNSGDQASIVRLGDASIASPFTSKSSSIRVVKKLIRQGRCTLVTTIQMYKILGINCLLTAYYLSSLFIYGVKSGDQQLTISGLSIAIFFLFLSRAKPARKLSHQRPPSGVFCTSVMVSIFGQFAIHLAFLAAALNVATPFIEHGDPAMHPDGKFTPNVVNSIMFLMSSIMQVNTFVANYRGQPFMEGFWENKQFSYSALLNYAVLAMIIAEVFTPLNAMLELVTLPNQETRYKVAALMAGDTLLALVFESAVQTIVSTSA